MEFWKLFKRDAFGQMYARLRGMYGATPKDVAVDSAGVMLSRMKGAYGEVLKDISVDSVGIMLSRMKGYDGSALQDLLVDSTGRIIAVMMGDDDGTPRLIKVDAKGRMEGVMKGDYEGTLKTIAVDTNGRMLAMMKNVTEAYRERESTTTASAGTNAFNFSEVPAGEIWEIYRLCVVNANSAFTYEWYIVNGTTYRVCDEKTSQTADTLSCKNLRIYVAAGEHLNLAVNDAILNDDIYAYAYGRKYTI